MKLITGTFKASYAVPSNQDTPGPMEYKLAAVYKTMNGIIEQHRNSLHHTVEITRVDNRESLTITHKDAL